MSQGGLFTFPFNIPGTLYHKCLKDQRRAISILKDLIKERLVSAKRYEDFLDVVIEEVKKFASFETVALTITLAINFISEHPSVLKDLMVIDETLRLANINPFLLRRATRDVQIKGGSDEECIACSRRAKLDM
ncbi:Cytochrome p450 [Thalictrum thalictroides]|uniref:Cytochrome p450 n=1 Tax=Thalictrum thalictroides TaxID=46969 RepID=A0A7J6X1S8_THATH|nr:Cytochrome p450 [Thalictrum thalictroides]